MKGFKKVSLKSFHQSHPGRSTPATQEKAAAPLVKAAAPLAPPAAAAPLNLSAALATPAPPVRKDQPAPHRVVERRRRPNTVPTLPPTATTQTTTSQPRGNKRNCAAGSTTSKQSAHRQPPAPPKLALKPATTKGKAAEAPTQESNSRDQKACMADDNATAISLCLKSAQAADVKPAEEGAIKAILATPRPTGNEGADTKPAEEGTIKAILATPRPTGDEGADTKPMEEGIFKASLTTPRNLCDDVQDDQQPMEDAADHPTPADAEGRVETAVKQADKAKPPVESVPAVAAHAPPAPPIAPLASAAAVDARGAALRHVYKMRKAELIACQQTIKYQEWLRHQWVVAGDVYNWHGRPGHYKVYTPAIDAHYLDACRSITMADMAQNRAEMDAAYLDLRRHELLHRSK